MLPTGKVLIVGGYNYEKQAFCNAIELYDPETGKFEVMEYLDYGIQNPKVILQKDGKVFLTGIAQNPMVPPPAKKTDNRRLVENRSRVTPVLIGSSLFGLLQSEDLFVDFVTINQGVERYLDDARQASKVIWNSTDPTVKPVDVPIINGRGAMVCIYLKGNRVEGRRAKIKAKLDSGKELPWQIITLKAENRLGAHNPDNVAIFGLTKDDMKKGQKLVVQLLLERAGQKDIFDPASEDIDIDLNIKKESKTLTINVVASKYYNDKSKSSAPDAMLAITDDMAEKWKAHWKTLLPVSDVYVKIYTDKQIDLDRKELMTFDQYSWKNNDFFIPFLSFLQKALKPSLDKDSQSVYLVLLPSKDASGKDYIQDLSGKPVSLDKIDFAGRTDPSGKRLAVLFINPDGTEYDYGGKAKGRLNTVHEMGHMFGSNHPFIPDAWEEKQWPKAPAYQRGTIGCWGWDISTLVDSDGNIASPYDFAAGLKNPTKYDLMTNKTDLWVSDFNFTRWWKQINR